MIKHTSLGALPVTARFWLQIDGFLELIEYDRKTVLQMLRKTYLYIQKVVSLVCFEAVVCLLACPLCRQLLIAQQFTLHLWHCTGLALFIRISDCGNVSLLQACI
jgi:hypothetical protein